jgi:uncharacterized membrane protein
MSIYFLAKFIHILIAILALGTSAGLGIVLELYGDHPMHGSFVLRIIERIELLFVVPGYVLMLATGLWMVHLGWPLTAAWIQAALGLWGLGLLLFVLSPLLLHRQIQLFDARGPASPGYKRISLLGRAAGAGGGLVVVLILYLMVFKPWR